MRLLATANRKDEHFRSIGSTASVPYTKEYGVIPIDILADVLYASRAVNSLTCHSLWFSQTVLLNIPNRILFSLTMGLWIIWGRSVVLHFVLIQ